MKKFPVTALISLFFGLSLLSSIATASNSQDDINSAATTWLALIDRGDYAASWQTASTFFQEAVSQDDWSKIVSAVRSPLGAVTSRQLTSSQEQTTLPGAPDGHYRIQSYFTSYTNKQSAIETLTLKQEADGSWRAAGYFIR
nr:DUF4019 domain-containing protein [uncultured Desulfobulbus sp.]